MLTHEIRNQLLVDELQLGTRLNQDIQTADHADFSLLLAMLSHDVTDNPEFSTTESSLKEEDLRKKFNLIPEQKKYAESSDFDRSQAITEQFSTDGMTQVFLSECLRDEPLVPFERTYSPEVFAQLTPLKQEKLRHQMKGMALTYEKIHETGDGFDILDEINSSRLQSKISATV